MATVENRQVVLERYIEGEPKVTDMAMKIGKMKLKAPKGSGAFLVKNLYLSCDPYMRGRMRDFHGSYIPPFVPSQPIEGFGVGKVLDSDNPDFKPGDFISGITGWEEYSLIHSTSHPQKGEYVFVSAASGAVGQLVGQLAKLHGCYVVGSAGSRQKLKSLYRYFPEGIDIYFDNVGGEILDSALLNMRIHGRIAVCGMVSLHSFSDPKGIHNLYCVVPKRIKIQGFLQSDYLDKFPEFLEHVTKNFKEGKIVYIEDMNDGLESGPAAFVGLFSGQNIGKQVICVARD
ncbi:hypothetical protein CXB51_035882 [Gossypium anomalum]|uniref:Oxidoreductase N-terminal domain-containing protein n=1 Tax=Gossypium anomalum TaxID=47600 RepID=A0A8J5Y5N7_9ROSI|nr:hypothetical protein CXB51_035882 [Gossypium anomalum]